MYAQARTQEHMDAMPIQAMAQSPARAAKKSGQSPYEGSPLPISGKLASHIRQSFGLNADELKLRESPQVAAMGARATAQGNAIRFAPGEFRPDTREGMAVLGHELSHVREQATGGVHAPGGELFEHPAHEDASNRAGEAFAAGSLTAAAPVSLSGGNAQSAPVQGLMNPLSWLKQQKKNFSFTKAEGAEQSAALDIQKQMNTNIKQGENLSLEDQLANAQYKARNYGDMRHQRIKTQSNKVLKKSEAQRGAGGYEQGHGGIGRWLAKRMFHKTGGAQAIADVNAQLNDRTDYGTQAAGLEMQIGQRNQEDLAAINYRGDSWDAHNAAKNRVYDELNLQRGNNTESRVASLMRRGGTEEDHAYNTEVVKALSTVENKILDSKGNIYKDENNKTYNEGGNAENYQRIATIVYNAYQPLLNYDIEAVARMPEREIVRRMPEIADIERPLMFLSDTMKKNVVNNESKKRLVDELFSPEDQAKILRKAGIIGYLQRSMEAKLKLDHPELHDQLGIDDEGRRKLTRSMQMNSTELHKMLGAQ